MYDAVSVDGRGSTLAWQRQLKTGRPTHSTLYAVARHVHHDDRALCFVPGTARVLGAFPPIPPRSRLSRPALPLPPSPARSHRPAHVFRVFSTAAARATAGPPPQPDASSRAPRPPVACLTVAVSNMADYGSLKVPELKKLLHERGLTLGGNKADLISRLHENDKAQQPSAPGPASE